MTSRIVYVLAKSVGDTYCTTGRLGGPRPPPLGAGSRRAGQLTKFESELGVLTTTKMAGVG